MLPDFPALKDALAKQLQDALERMADSKAPLLAGIKRMRQHEGKMHSYDRIGAGSKTDGPEEIAIQIKVERAEVPELVGEKLMEKLDVLATELAQKRMDLFHRRFREATAEVGNAFNANGAPLTQDLFLTMLDRVEMDFDVNGQPIGEFALSSLDMEAAVRKWFSDQSFLSRYNSIVNRKRDEWRDRESDRKLVD